MCMHVSHATLQCRISISISISISFHNERACCLVHKTSTVHRVPGTVCCSYSKNAACISNIPSCVTKNLVDLNCCFPLMVKIKLGCT